MSTSAFYEADFPSALFPLRMNLLMIQLHEKELSEYVYQNVLNQNVVGHSFLPQQRVHATKQRAHLRRTAKLDPVAEYFLYDLVYRNRALFKKSFNPDREAFGYRFQEGNHISVHTAYRAFRARVHNCKKEFAHFLAFDIAAYFNTLYHHDVHAWFEASGAGDSDALAFGQFGREINAGRSIDFLPHGIYPAKMIGSEFLKFVDNTGELKSAVLLRFMDDFYLFDQSPDVVRSDFLKIQQLLGSKSLNVNAAKTRIDDIATDIGTKITEIKNAVFKVQLASQMVDEIAASGDDDVDFDYEVEQVPLSQEQLSTLLELLKDDHIEEIDADKILGIMLGDANVALSVIPDLLQRFPNIVRSVYQKASAITEDEALAVAILQFVAASPTLLEYQVFWLAKLVEERLLKTKACGDLLMALYERSTPHVIACAKVLEIPDQRFGFKEIRADYLKTGASNWLTWASAFGSRSLPKAERNYSLAYFSKCSPLNYLVASCVSKI